MSENIVFDGITGCLECLICNQMKDLKLPKSLTEILLIAEKFKEEHKDCKDNNYVRQ